MKRFVIELSDEAYATLRAYTKAENVNLGLKNNPKQTAAQLVYQAIQSNNMPFDAPDEWDDVNAPEFKAWKTYWKELDRLGYGR